MAILHNSLWLLSPPVKNLKILLQPCFSARISSLIVANTFGSGRDTRVLYGVAGTLFYFSVVEMLIEYNFSNQSTILISLEVKQQISCRMGFKMECHILQRKFLDNGRLHRY